jgi:hypothetical protein
VGIKVFAGDLDIGDAEEHGDSFIDALIRSMRFGMHSKRVAKNLVL